MRSQDVKRLRKQMGLTQEGLAKLVGVHPMTVSRWERGVVGVPAPTARLITLLAKDDSASKAKEKRR